MIEYEILPTYGLPVNGEVLQKMGRDGWQLVTIEHGTAYFSRQVQPEPQPAKTTRRKRAAKNAE